METSESDDELANLTLPVPSEDDFLSSMNLSSDTGFIPAGSSSSVFVPSPKKLSTSTPKKLRAPKIKTGQQEKPLFKCTVCGNRLTTEKGLSKHLSNHRLQEAACRRPSLDTLLTASVSNACRVASEILEAPVADSPEGLLYTNFAKTVYNFSTPEPTREFCAFVKRVVEPLQPLLVTGPTAKAYLPSTLKKEIRGVLQRLVVDPKSRSEVRDKLISVTGEVGIGLPEKYIQEFCRRFTDISAAYVINLMRDTSKDPHEHKKCAFSEDNFSSLFSQQTLHRIVGYSVKAALRKARRYRNSKRWQDFQAVLLECFASIGTCVADPQDKSFWTALLARKSLVFVNDKALEFFIEVAKVMCYSETREGNLLKEDVLSNVMESPGLMLLWDNIICGKLSDSESLSLMRCLVQSLCGTFGKGILLRRMNKLAEDKRAAVTAVGLRAKLTR